MTQLVYAVANYLASQPSVTELVGVDDLGDPMIYANRPEATIENTQTSMIVVTSTEGWGANDHNTARFPVLVIDIWSDPTRNDNLTVRQKDADLKIEAVYKAVDKFLHRVHNSEPGGVSVMWGTQEQISTRTGLRIISSSRQNEPDLRPAFNDEGAMMGSIRYHVTI